MLLGSIAAGAYSLDGQIHHIADAFLAVGVAHALLLLAYRKNDVYVHDAGSIAAVSILAPALLSYQRPGMMLAGILAAISLGAILTVTQRRIDPNDVLHLGIILISPRIIIQQILHGLDADHCKLFSQNLTDAL